MPLTVAPTDFLILSILVLGLGGVVNRRVAWLGRNNIPLAVTGGLLFSVGAAIFTAATDRPVAFDLRARDLLLLVFFSTIGLDARLREVVRGGKQLGVLLLAATVFLVLQDVTGVGIALLLGAHPGYGLMAGSVSFAGGHGTAIAWGAEAEKAGLLLAPGLGVAFATFGLVAGGLIGGPVAGRLIERRRLAPRSAPVPEPVPADPVAEDSPVASAEAGQLEPPLDPLTVRDVLITILKLAVCVGLGDSVNRYLFSKGVLLPGFLTAMLVGVALGNLGELRRGRHDTRVLELARGVSLQLFLSMSLMSMDLTSLGTAVTPILIVLFCQTLLITLFTVYVLFRLMGRNYEAAVISAGFLGLGLGATPVAIANMESVTSKYGPSPRAFLAVTLLGAFFVDLMNAVVIKGFLATPWFQRAFQ